jgi:uncharacterized protein (DUF58 family)
MTPQEQELVEELFDRLAKLENSPRDPTAERVIADGLRHTPQATYALVQTALVQDEALKRANARIEELQAQLGGGEQEQQQGASSTVCAKSYWAGASRAVRYTYVRLRRKRRRCLHRPMVDISPDIRWKCRPVLLSARAVRFSALPHQRQRG